MKKIFTFMAAMLVAFAVNAQTDFAAPGYNCLADAAVLTGGSSSNFYLKTDVDPHCVAWSDVSLSSNALATWTVTATRGCYVTVSLDLGPIIGSNKHNFEVTIKDANGYSKGMLTEGGENTASEQVKVLTGTILLPTAGIYTVEVYNNRDWGKGCINKVILTYESDAPASMIEVTSIELNKTELALEVDEVEQLAATVLPADAFDPSVTWESSDATIATVADGFVTAIAAGTATITAKAGEKSTTCAVTVSAATIPSTDFAEPYVFSAKKAHIEGAIWKMYTNDAYKLYGDGDHNKNYGTATWEINVTKPCIVSGMLNGVEGGHIFGLDLYQGEELLGSLEQPDGKTWSKGEIALDGALAFAAVGNYTLKLRNTQEWSSGKAAGVTLTYQSDLPAEHTYTVAGDNVDVFGTSWDPTNTANDMFLQEDQTYKWEKTGLTLPAGSIQFKVVKNHDWNNGAYPAGNYVLNIPEAGIYTIDIYYNPNDNNYVGAVATKTGEAVVIPSIAMHGNFTGTWKDTENFTIAEGNATASLTMNIEAGNYEFGMRIGGPGNWTSNGAAFTRENNSAEIVADQGNLTLAADEAGEYTFTWTYETNTLAITFPAATPVVEEWDEIVFTEVAAKGSLNGAVFASATNANFTLTVTDTDASKVEIDANTARFGTPEAFKDYTHRLKTGGKSSSKNLLTLAIPAAGTLRIAVRTGKNEDATRTVVLTQGENELYNAFVKEDDKQVIDNTNYYPYIEVAVEAGSVLVTYPVNGLNFYAFGFKAAQSGTGIEETIAEKKAVKMIENGQLVIIKNGVRYNVMGAVLR